MQNVEMSALERCAGNGSGLVEAWSANNQHGPITSIVAGSVIVVGGADGSVKQWSFDGGAPEYLSPFTRSGAEVGGLALTADAHVVAATKLGEVTEWRLADAGQERSMTIADASLTAVAARPDGIATVTGTSTGEVFALDRATSERTQLTSQLWGVSALAYGASNTLFTAGHFYGVPRVEQRAADAPVAFTSAWQDDARSGNVRALDVDAGGTQLVVGGDGFVAVFAAGQLDEGPVAITDVPEHLVTGVTLLPGGEMFATTGSEGTLKIWRTATAQLVTSLAIPASAGIARDAEGTRLLSAGADGKVYAYGCR
jgi:WD40 repeat protein